MTDINHATVLIVDDDEAIRDSLSQFLEAHDLAVATAANPRIALEALERLQSTTPPVIITDIRMPHMDGISFMAEAKKLHPEAEVLVITGHSHEQLAIDALRAGAFDYFKKPLNARAVLEAVRRTRRFQELKAENTRLRAAVAHQQRPALESAAYFSAQGPSAELQQRLVRVAQIPSTTVLLAGESGTGKEVAARFIHEHSPQPALPFIALNCGGTPESLLESELFGHEKGAFTGAVKTRPGIFEAATGGTVFLDEISEMSMAAQSRFLRVLESRSFRRVGGNVEIPVGDTRIICASNKDLQAMVAAGSFREDLLFRINIARITLPPLRQRPADIMPLAQRFLAALSRRMQRRLTLSKAAEAALLAHPFPGNIRELKNMLEQAAIFASSDSLEPLDLNISERHGEKSATAFSPQPATVFPDNLNLAEHEERLIRIALEQAQGVHAHAARLLGITPQALYRKLDKHDIAKS